MPQVVTVSARRHNPYEGIHGQHARDMLQLFKSGARLFVWRGTTPHNWWLETTDGVSHTVSGDHDTNGILGIEHLNIPDTLRKLGRRVFSSPERVPSHSLHGDGGLPFKEGWEFDPLRVSEMESKWEEVQQAVHLREQCPPTFKPDLKALSTEALALLRTLKAKASVYPYEELLHAFTELDQQGFLLMNSRGEFCLHDEAKAVTVPRGEHMKLRFTRKTQ
jgi:hypothetical protein